MLRARHEAQGRAALTAIALTPEEAVFLALAEIAALDRLWLPEVYERVDAIKAQDDWTPFASMRQPRGGATLRECPWCGDDFLTPTAQSRKRYCSVPCRAAYQRWVARRRRRDNVSPPR